MREFISISLATSMWLCGSDTPLEWVFNTAWKSQTIENAPSDHSHISALGRIDQVTVCRPPLPYFSLAGTGEWIGVLENPPNELRL